MSEENLHTTTFGKVFFTLAPTKIEIVISIFVGALVVLLLKLDQILLLFGVSEQTKTLSEYIKRSIEGMEGNGFFLNIAGTALLWFLLGTVGYIVLWAATVAYVDWKNNVEISAAFVHPDSFHQSDFWAAVLGRMLLRASSLLLIVILIPSFLFKTLPGLYDLNHDTWSSNGVLYAILIALGSGLLVVLAQYVLIALLRLAALKQRIFG